MSSNPVEITTLKKAQVLWDKIQSSFASLNEEQRSKINDIYQAYILKLEQLSNALHDQNENVSQTKEKALFNRGDAFKCRFYKATRDQIIEDQISRLTKEFIENIEDAEICQEFIKACQQNGVYEVLYHNPVIGEYSTGIWDRRQLCGIEFLNSSKKALLFAATGVAFFSTVALLGLGGAWMVAGISLLTASMTYMAGIFYGIINDMFATQANLTYFLLGHQPHQNSYYKTNDPLALSIGWGIVGTHYLSVIAATIFGITAALVTAFSSTHILVFALPILFAIVPVLALVAEGVAKLAANKYINKINNLSPEKIHEDFFKDKDFNLYQRAGLDIMTSSRKQKANWKGNGARNGFGYLVIPIVAIIDITLMLSLQSAPEFLYSSLFSVTIPIVTAVFALVSLYAAQRYLTNNQDKQIDNRYKLITNSHYDWVEIDRLYVNEVQPALSR